MSNRKRLELEPQIELIQLIESTAVRRILDRAKQRSEQVARQQQRALANVSMGRGHLAAALGAALAILRIERNGRSLRATAPDTGGRPFHFALSTVTKGRRGRHGRGSPSNSAGATSAGNGIPNGKAAQKGRQRERASSREGAHQIYTERDEAVEPGRPVDTGADNRGALPANGSALEEGATDLPVGSPEAAAQFYIENPQKVFGHTSSFGTIGESLTERLNFWELVHEHESAKGGRTQSRLILELPHEASAEERYEIVRQYTDKTFRAKGLPYWASIHTPTKDNDSRNFHAHVVFLERPARKMPHPETSELVWDFTIAERYRNSTRHVRTRYPYRQNRDPEMRDRGWLKRARAHFAAVTNEVMEPGGKPVRYDPRSYEDMGLDVRPLRPMGRNSAEKAKSEGVPPDPERTRRMIDNELLDTAARRSRALAALEEHERQILSIARNGFHKRGSSNVLPRHLWLGPSLYGGTQAGDALAGQLVGAERDRLESRFTDDVVDRCLSRIVAATSMPDGGGSVRVPGEAAAEDGEALAHLNTAAAEELADHRRRSRLERQRTLRGMEAIRHAWNCPMLPNPYDSSAGSYPFGGFLSSPAVPISAANSTRPSRHGALSGRMSALLEQCLPPPGTPPDQYRAALELNLAEVIAQNRAPNALADRMEQVRGPSPGSADGKGFAKPAAEAEIPPPIVSPPAQPSSAVSEWRRPDSAQPTPVDPGFANQPPSGAGSPGRGAMREAPPTAAQGSGPASPIEPGVSPADQDDDIAAAQKKRRRRKAILARQRRDTDMGM